MPATPSSSPTAAPSAEITISVASEHGRLRTVVMCLANPDVSRSFEQLLHVDVETFHQVRRWRHDPYDVDVVHGQQQAFIDVLRSRDVEVLLAERQPGIVSQHYTRDIGFAIDSVFFVARPRREFRQRELVGARGIIERMSRVAWLDRGTIEGGDVMLHDGLVLVGRGEETSAAGIEALAYALDREGIERTVVTLEFAHRGTIHLDDDLAIVAPGLALVHRPAFKPESLRWIEDNLELIDTTPQELRELRINAFALAPNLVVLEAGSTRIAAELERRGVETILLDYSEVNKLPGSFRCTTLPLRRDT